MESKLKVQLLSYSPNPDKVVSTAAKLCYSPVGIEDIQKKLTDVEVEKFLTMLINMHHESPLEHVSFTFAVEGISRSCSHQIVRHRIASYSQQSQRYVKLDQFEYIVPPQISKCKEAKERYIKSMEEAQNAYNEIYSLLFLNCVKEDYIDLYNSYEKEINMDIPIDLYIKENNRSIFSKIEKKVIEDARYVFPNSCETKIMLTMNARSLINFFNHRCCQRAQWEIRELACEMLKQVKEVAPILFSNSGPKCVGGTCPEGKMSCGKSNEMKMKFK